MSNARLLTVKWPLVQSSAAVAFTVRRVLTPGSNMEGEVAKKRSSVAVLPGGGTGTLAALLFEPIVTVTVTKPSVHGPGLAEGLVTVTLPNRTKSISLAACVQLLPNNGSAVPAPDVVTGPKERARAAIPEGPAGPAGPVGPVAPVAPAGP